MNRKLQIRIGQWLTILLLLAAVQPALGQAVAINATVNGVSQQIGTLDAMQSMANAGRMIGKFVLNPNFSYLDVWYDFQWVNVETRYENPVGTPLAVDPVTGTLPAIDPQGPPTNAAEDNKPYYYNDGEWLPPGQAFAEGIQIHVEGTSSTFLDRPSDGTKNSKIFFSTFLTIDNKTDPAFPANTFPLIGVIDWNYMNNGNPANGVSNWTRVSGVTTAADVAQVNTAIGNAGPNGFGTWKAVAAQNLTACPEPAALAMAATVAFVVGGWRRNQRFSHAHRRLWACHPVRLAA